MRPHLISFLQDGKRPDPNTWPLPDSGFELCDRRRSPAFPDNDLLIEIALLEKDLDKALRLYDSKPQRANWAYIWSHSLEEQLADAIKEKYPDRSILIWKKITEGLIAGAKPRDYSAAIAYLKKIRNVLKKNNRDAEFAAYLAALREQHKRKYRLVEMLDTLTSRRVIDDATE